MLSKNVLTHIPWITTFPTFVFVLQICLSQKKKTMKKKTNWNLKCEFSKNNKILFSFFSFPKLVLSVILAVGSAAPSHYGALPLLDVHPEYHVSSIIQHVPTAVSHQSRTDWHHKPILTPIISPVAIDHVHYEPSLHTLHSAPIHSLHSAPLLHSAPILHTSPWGWK